jgi:Ankyrin repeats (3 copies)/Ankyrin repeats (many copies)
MSLTHAQRTGLEAAILAYLDAKGERFSRTVATFKEEANARGDIGVDALEVSGAVLKKAWEKYFYVKFQSCCLDTAVLEYLIAEGGRFARTVTAFKEDARQPGGFIAGVLDRIVGGYTALVARIRGATLEKAWVYVHGRLVCDVMQSTVFFGAIESGDVAEVQLYVCVGIDVDLLEEEESRAPPLSWAARYNRLEIVRFFVKTGHHKEMVDFDGASALYVAAEKGYIAVVQYLVEHGADKDAANYNGWTPLFVAAHEGHITVVRCLVDHGADKDKTDRDGMKPLFLAALAVRQQRRHCSSQRCPRRPPRRRPAPKTPRS